MIGQDLQVSQDTISTTLHIDWRGVFQGDLTNYRYEISLGTDEGLADIVQWQETMSTNMQVQVPKFDQEYAVIVTAINPCGGHDTYQRIYTCTYVLRQAQHRLIDNLYRRFCKCK